LRLRGLGAPAVFARARARVFLLLAALVPLAAAAGQATGQASEARTFEITASRFKFEPDTIEVTEGDEVRLTLHSADTNHGLEIKELKVKIKIPKGGGQVSVGFVAARAGTFAITCSEYCGSGHRRMKGTLVVAPRRPE
jgi:heme/copper-type cytochrome/quinol oxidase subunit 2